MAKTILVFCFLFFFLIATVNLADLCWADVRTTSSSNHSPSQPTFTSEYVNVKLMPWNISKIYITTNSTLKYFLIKSDKVSLEFFLCHYYNSTVKWVCLFFPDLESYVQGHKKKHGLKSPCQGWVAHAFSNIFESIEHSHKISKNTKCLRYKIVLYIQNLSDNKQWNVFFFSYDNDIYLLSSSLSSSKSLPGDSRRGGHRVDLNGPAESRKSSSIRNSQEAEQVTLRSDHSRVTCLFLL